MTFLLDVNVLIALIDPAHVGHDAAHRWFEADGHKSWATCPITENGVIRIVGHPKFPNAPGNPGAVIGILQQMRGLPGHVFWADDVTLTADGRVDHAQIVTPAQVTDTYLLLLAVARGGRLATLDRRLSSRAVNGGKAALFTIPA